MIQKIPPRRYRLQWLLVPLIIVGLTMLFLIGRYRLTVDTDIVASLPLGDPIVSDGRSVIQHHPIQDRVVIDLGHSGHDPDLLL